MCYAAWSKGSTALLCAVLAAANATGVWAELQQRWEADIPGFGAQAINRARQSTLKAWRFAGEMDEIAAMFAAAGLPGGMHTAAAELYRRLAPFKDAPEPPLLDAVLAALLQPGAND
jgi:hypothetical protein